MPPILPMLAKPASLDKVLAMAPNVQLEPKWDGFRAIIFKDQEEVEIASRNTKSMTRYFPDVVASVRQNFPERAVIDGEIILINAEQGRLDFEMLQQRVHPAASRVALLAETVPAAFVAFDLLALDDVDHMQTDFATRRELLTAALQGSVPPVWVTPATTDLALARQWFTDFEGAGLDGLIAKPADIAYHQDKRVMFKIKHERTCDCVLAGYRTHKGNEQAIGSLLLGLYDETGALASVGVIGAFPMATRKTLFAELQPLVTDLADHPWSWAAELEFSDSGARSPQRGAGSRWNNGKDLSFTPLRPERVVEVRYDYLEGRRFRHTAQFSRWRPDRDPASCTFAQTEVAAPYDLAEVLNQ